MQHYRSKDWKSFRAEVIRLDGGRCVRCARRAEDGAVLSVHHKRYIRGHKPWDYPHELCETLCTGCHAATHGLIPPTSGWEYAGWEDLGDLSGTCDACSTAIRYCFLITHAEWYPIEVGTDCCDRLTATADASEHVAEHQRMAGKLKRFVSSTRWHSLGSGSVQIKHKGIYACVRRVDEGAFRLFFDNYSGRKVFSSELEAKVAVFELFESGKIQEFLAKRRRRRT